MTIRSPRAERSRGIVRPRKMRNFFFWVLNRRLYRFGSVTRVFSWSCPVTLIDEQCRRRAFLQKVCALHERAAAGNDVVQRASRASRAAPRQTGAPAAFLDTGSLNHALVCNSLQRATYRSTVLCIAPRCAGVHQLRNSGYGPTTERRRNAAGARKSAPPAASRGGAATIATSRYHKIKIDHSRWHVGFAIRGLSGAPALPYRVSISFREGRRALREYDWLNIRGNKIDELHGHTPPFVVARVIYAIQLTRK